MLTQIKLIPLMHEFLPPKKVLYHFIDTKVATP